MDALDTSVVGQPGPSDTEPGPPLPSTPLPPQFDAVGSRWMRHGATVLLVGLLSGTVGATITHAVDTRSITAIRVGPAPASGPPRAARALQLSGTRLDVAAVVAKVGPSVVSIQSELSRGPLSGRAAGTGILLTANGEVLTNAHVVEGASSVTITLAGESQSRSATVIGADPTADLALLKIPNASGLAAAALGTSAAVAVGDDVVAIGNALALRGGPTVTRGIVSALDRSLDTGASTMTGLIQTDASISSGNSGGPLVDATGKVIGINSAVATSGGTTAAENIGFAIAIDTAMPVVERLRNHTPAAVSGYLGVGTADPTDGSRGAIVRSVAPGSAAATAGIQPGDLITAVDGKAIDGAAALSAAVRAHAPGAPVRITLLRGGTPRIVTADLSTRPSA